MNTTVNTNSNTNTDNDTLSYVLTATEVNSIMESLKYTREMYQLTMNQYIKDGELSDAQDWLKQIEEINDASVAISQTRHKHWKEQQLDSEFAQLHASIDRIPFEGE